MKTRPRRRTGRPWRRVAMATAAVLTGTLIQASGVPAVAQAAWHKPALPKAESPVKGGPAGKAVPRTVTKGPRTPAKAPATNWPRTTAATVTLDKDTTRVKGLPLTLDTRVKKTSDAADGTYTVRTLSRKAARKTGVDGPVFTLTPGKGGTQRAGKARAALDYSSFAGLYGGGYASRLTLVQLPACALTTPQKAKCRTTRPVETVNDTDKQTLTTKSVSLSAGSATVLAATTAASSDKGDYTATSLSASSTWNTDLSSGSFAWSYDMSVPKVPGGLTPQVGLSYSSGGVDGRTGNSNNQASWVGDGFDLAPGFIERSYKSCEKDGATNADGKKPGDLCWAFDNATLSLNGSGGELVPNGTNSWKLQNDDGTKVDRIYGSSSDVRSNGARNDEYWRVTTPDGTKYFFGYNRLPGWASGNETTDSTWTVPVFGNNADEPCNASTFASSWCQQGWRWNLDYVVDRRGNAVAYYYDKETNSYGRNVTAADDTPYVRGGTLDRVEYGLKSTAMYSTKALAKVDLTSSERCIADSSTTCSSISTDSQYWYDTPWDLNCEAGTDCDDGRYSPAFFTRKRLTEVATQVYDGSGYKNVDSWKLTHRWGMADTDYQLLLDSVQRTGHDGTASITLPKTTFAYTQLANRLDKTGDGYAPYIKDRLSTIADDSGGQIDVNYSAPVCDFDALPTPQTNTTRCFPQYIGGSSSDDPELQWFNKYVVDTVTATDRTGGSPDQVTMYDYLDGAAWHYDDDDGMSKAKLRTWSQWRGYGHVRVRTGGQGGASAMKTQQDSYFLRGMDGDRKEPSGGTKSVSVTLDSGEGDPITDHESQAGFAYRTVTYSGPGGKVLEKSVSRPWYKETAKKVRDWGTVTANFTGTASSKSWTSLDDGAGAKWRTTSGSETHDPATGLVVQSEDLGDTTTAADNQCTRTTYVTGSVPLATPARVETVAKACDATTNRPDDVISDVRTAYDGGAYGAAATKGDATRTAKLKTYTGTSAVYLESSSTFDSYGRALTTTDLTADVTVTAAGALTRTARTGGRTTTTAYTPATGFATSSKVTTPPATAGDSTTAQTSTTTYETLRGLPLTETDTNSKVTTYAYDALGRTTKVWQPDRTTGQTPSYEFTYTITDGKQVAVGTKTIGNSGAQDTSYALYDGFLRPRQTQAPGPDGGTLLADTFYDERGLTAKEFASYYITGAPSTTLFKPADALSVETQDRYTYDGLGRVTELRQIAGNGDGGTVLGVTKTLYGGDRTTVIPPVGGTAQTAVTDARGRTTELRLLHSRSADAAYDTTSYGYSPRGELTKVTDPAGNAWTWTYDLMGRLTDTTDPDKGAGHLEYDDRSRMTVSRNPNGVLAYAYDGLGRKTEMRENSSSGTLRAKWVYDTISGAKGQLASSSRFSGGQEYKTSVVAYDRLYRPLRTSVTIPSSEGGLQGTYLSATTYNDSGTVQGVGYPKAGDLAANTVTYTYEDGTLRPVGVSGPLNLTASTSYSLTGKPLQYSMAANGGKATYETNTYQWGTQRLATSRVDRQDVAGVDQFNTYTYDEAGNVLSVSDTSRSGTDNQCFSYDHLGRVKEAWAQSTTGCVATPTTGAVGGPAPYWTSYTYDKVGNRLTETQHATTAGGSDTEREYHYPDPGAVRPHALTSVDNTAGTVKSRDSFTYDDAGNTHTRLLGDGTSQTLDWDAEGRLAKVTEPVEGGSDKVTEYLYDTEGNRLIGRTPTETTLYLGPTEITLAKGATAPKGTRYFDLGGGHTAVQANDGKISFTLADHHGTAQLSVDATTQALTQRRTLPFGGPRGTEPTNWSGTKGFVGGTIDTATGLTHLGAREYDPTIGRFLSVDPVFTDGDPQQMHGYTYANNNPLTYSDPAGTEIGSKPNSCQYSLANCSKQTQQEVGYDPKSGTTDYRRGNIYKRSQAAKKYWIASNTPVTNDIDKLADQYWSPRMNGEFTDDFWYNPVYESSQKGREGTACFGREGCRQAYLYVLHGGKDVEKAKELAATYCVYNAEECNEKAAAVARGNVIKDAIATAVLGYLGGAMGARPCNSFVPGTEVLMADGTTKRVEDVKTGDRILATDPRTGRTTAKTVTAEITGKGRKNLVRITLSIEVDGKKKTAAITATDGHPFWVPALGTWTDATELTAGERLRTSTGALVEITAIDRWTQAATVHNLTVADFHTYYVLAGVTPVLVHNSTACGPAQSVHNLKEVVAPKPLKPAQVEKAWSDFLGPGPYTNIHPRTGQPDPSRLVSADGRRSIRMGDHEMNSKPTKFHYHMETWDWNSVNNTWTVSNTMQRVPLGVK
ncbi:polymorphic toxin-type HINT domain-containing protein [Streptomyces caniscabiei]|uniref:polymorphic toxin-type HINT domain-containing protein n=2 Tax=Streptomyces caniscabiei TaxID=2746961 RepID=UPI0029B13CE4|nr:polymorphic toxin-type HINT domain-containing protein [Streptomyces caniscabiei]MDX2602880.1 polymorphic toxin-type HINT domain-containing protein [Streptomyces caniscabiei]MDX2778714.1 polymorphic toxin-type HINT domain-containing protein [Streptomyces caniscabiei]